MRDVEPVLDKSYKCIKPAMATPRLGNIKRLDSVIKTYQDYNDIFEKLRSCITTTKKMKIM